MIRAALADMVLAVDGCCAAVLTDPDGVAVDAIVVDESVDSELLAAGAADLLARSDRFAREAGASALAELSLVTDSLTFVARPVGHEYRLLMVLTAGCDHVQARNALGRAVDRLQSDLIIDEPAAGVSLDHGPVASV